MTFMHDYNLLEPPGVGSSLGAGSPPGTGSPKTSMKFCIVIQQYLTDNKYDTNTNLIKCCNFIILPTCWCTHRSANSSTLSAPSTSSALSSLSSFTTSSTLCSRFWPVAPSHCKIQPHINLTDYLYDCLNYNQILTNY